MRVVPSQGAQAPRLVPHVSASPRLCGRSSPSPFHVAGAAVRRHRRTLSASLGRAARRDAETQRFEGEVLGACGWFQAKARRCRSECLMSPRLRASAGDPPRAHSMWRSPKRNGVTSKLLTFVRVTLGETGPCKVLGSSRNDSSLVRTRPRATGFPRMPASDSCERRMARRDVRSQHPRLGERSAPDRSAGVSSRVTAAWEVLPARG